MIKVYEAQSLADAQFVVDRLSRAGIATYVRNEALQGALGELPFTLCPEVCILSDSDLELARELVREHLAAVQSPHTLADQVCGTCGELSPGNFELCWKCRRPFPEH